MPQGIDCERKRRLWISGAIAIEPGGKFLAAKLSYHVVVAARGHVAHVAGPVGVMTTSAVYWPGCLGGGCCWADAAAVTAPVAIQAAQAMEPKLLDRLPIVRAPTDRPLWT